MSVTEGGIEEETQSLIDKTKHVSSKKPSIELTVPPSDQDNIAIDIKDCKQENTEWQSPSQSKEEVFFDDEGYGMFNWSYYRISSKSIIVQNRRFCRTNYQQLEMRLVTDISLTQNWLQWRKGAGIIKFYTVDPLYENAPITVIIQNVRSVFKKIVAYLIKYREEFELTSRKKTTKRVPEYDLYEDRGYYCCVQDWCNYFCPVTYKITNKNIWEEQTFLCTHTVNFLSMQRVFQVEMNNTCCRPVCGCFFPEAGEINLWTTDDSAGNVFILRIPHEAKDTFHKIQSHIDLEKAMLDRLNMKRVAGMALDSCV